MSIVGRPNVGKSTLLNQILHEKVAITSDRPQTTRNAIRGIYTTKEAQLVFVDTPGFHRPRTALGERLNALVRSTMGEVDVVVFVVDAHAGVGRGDAFIAQELHRHDVPVVAVLNKIDVVSPAELDGARRALAGLGPDWPQYGVSARTGAGVRDLLGALAAAVPPGPLYYPPHTLTDQPLSQLAAELVREQALHVTREEVPHSIAVVVDEIEDEDGLVRIHATIYVERDSQKAIVIGRGGSMLRTIGTRARAEIERILGRHVYLDLHVKTARDWQRREAAIERFGYGRP